MSNIFPIPSIDRILEGDCTAPRLRVVPYACVAITLLVLVGRAADADDVEALALADGIPESAQAVVRDHCLSCHNPEDPNGGLDFTQTATLIAHADSGEIPFVAGDGEASEILNRVLASDDDLKMPPDGEELTREEIQILREWVANASKEDMRQADSGARTVTSDHWSFQPIREPALPTVRATEWSESPIDRFLQARRESLGLESTPPADAQTLLRRVTFALTGLPPTRDELHRFLADIDNEIEVEVALAKTIEELLSRQTYGQRWGRHWMDWVRYADTAGCNSDFPIPQAYLYRNYIVNSFNADIPYDQFLVEQLAGDLLPAATQAERNRLTIATGYLAMARRFGSLVETYPWHLTIEDTIDNVGRTMMGLTLSCARCHDHKFDPISTRDYYGLYGVFESTKYAFPGIELFQVQKDMVPLVSPDEAKQVLGEHDKKTRQLELALERELDKCKKRELENAKNEIGATIAEQRKMHDELQAMLLKARNAGKKLAEHLKMVPDLPVAYAVQEGTPKDAKIHIKGEPTRQGATVPRRFPKILGGYLVETKQQSGRLEVARWIANSNNPLTARVIVNRVWQRHFGKGLVDSTSDFGIRGETPSHPDLLDWLASDFMANGWSLKHLHRRIMNSRTYRLASVVAPEPAANSPEVEFGHEKFVRNLQSDPQNQFLWKFPRQRLDAESIRDALLFVSGRLDSTPQTEPFPIPPQKDWKYTQHHPFKDDYQSNKRSLYQMTKRLTVESYMQTFDGPDPNVCTSNRDQSVTALQALYFVNDEFLHDRADDYALRLLKLPTDASKVNQAVEEILNRKATESELRMLVGHLRDVRSRLSGEALANPSEESVESRALASMTRSLFRLNEFIYVD